MANGGIDPLQSKCSMEQARGSTLRIYGVQQGVLYHPSNQANQAVDPPEVAPPAGVAPDPTHKDEDLPPLLGHVTARVQEEMDCVNKKHEIGQLTHEQLLAHLIKLKKSSNIVTEFASSKVEKPKAGKQRITAKNIFGNKGIATGPENRRM